MKKILSILALAASASGAMAAFTPITNITFTFVPGVNPVRDEINLTSLTTMGNTFNAATTALGNGTTTLTNGVAYANIDRMDNLNLNDLATGMTAPWRTLMFAGVYFTNQNGALPDFFLFEAAGGADPENGGQVAAIFEGATTSDADDIYGVGVPIGNNAANNALATGWGDTGTNITANANNQTGQDIIGIAWDITDLKDAAGVNLTSSTVIKGIAMVAAFGNLDPCAMLAVVPPSGIDHFSVSTTAGSPQLVGVPFDVSIIAQDASNVTVDNSFTTVSMTAAGTLMEFDWNQDGTYGDRSGKLTNGLATIKARNKRAETTASGVVASAGLATTVSAPSVTTVADVFSQLQVLAPGETAAPGTDTGKNGNPTVQGVGAPFSLTVNGVDLYWNLVSSAADTISIFSTNSPSPIAALADAPLAGGTVAFNVSFITNGIYTLFATNVSNGLITNGQSSPINASIALVWKGDGIDNKWDKATANWTNLLGTALPFTDGSFVTFDDTGSYTPAINIDGTNSALAVNLTTANNVSFVTTNNGGITGVARLSKLGTGNLSISTSNSYTGGTVFDGGASGGVLTLANSGAIPNSGALILTNTTLLLEADLNHTTGSTRIVGSPTASGGSFTVAAVGGNRSLTLHQLTWGNTGNNLFPGEIGASLILGRASDNTTLTINNRFTLSVTGTTGTRRFVVDDGSQAVDVLITAQIDDASASPGNFVKQGAGTLELSSTANNWDGETAIEGGKLLMSGGWGATVRTITLGDGGSANATLQLGNATRNVNPNIGTITTSGSGTYRVIGGHPVTNSILTFNTNAVTSGSSSLSIALGGPGANENQLGLTKAGSNYTLTLDAANTYTGPTTINAGTLALGASGSINNSTNIDVQVLATFDVSAPGSFTLGSGKVLRGNGTVVGNVTVNGLLTPGAGTTGIGILTFNNNLTLGATATNIMEIHSGNATNDNVTVLGTLTGGGTLTVNNLGSTAALTNGQTFKLFSGAVSGFTTVTLPAAPVYLQWTNKLAVDGSIALVALPTPAPATITNSVSGSTLTLNWPAGQGWTLQAQTNSLAVGIATNWAAVSTVPPFVTTIIPGNPTVFYRLWFPVFP